MSMLLTLLVGSVALAQSKMDAPEPAPRAWRGTSIVYDNSISAPTFLKSVDLTWDPYYAQALSLRPEYHFGDTAVVRARLDFEKELTNSDDTTRYRQIMMSDLSVEGEGQLWQERRTGIGITGNLRAIAPLSLASQARTLVLGIQPAVNLTRKFGVLGGLTLGYGARFTYNFNRATTAQYDAPTIGYCQLVDECARFQNAGLRNSQWGLATGPAAALNVTDKLTLSSMYLMIKSFLYPLANTSVTADTGAVIPDPSGDVSYRSAQRFVFDISYQLTPQLGLSTGVLTDYADLQPDSTYRQPFLNRFSNIYFDISVDLESAARRFRL